MIKEFKQLTESINSEETYEIFKHCMYMPTKKKYDLKVDGWLCNENIKVYGYFEERHIKGIIVISLEGNDVAEILGISVDTKYRNCRIGSYMIKQIVGIYSLKSLMAETDDEAVEFYRKNGFEIREDIKIYNGEESVRYVCELSLLK